MAFAHLQIFPMKRSNLVVIIMGTTIIYNIPKIKMCLLSAPISIFYGYSLVVD